MELKQIEYFLQLAKMQHMSRTAEFLNISQPTLSKSLNALERDLGVSLFDRVGNRLQLNDSGKQFYSKAQQAMHTLGNAVISAKQASFEVSGEVSIVCIAFAPILVPCICAYMELNPKVNVRLLHFNHLLNSSGEVDYDFILTASRYALDLGEGERLHHAPGCLLYGFFRRSVPKRRVCAEKLFSVRRFSGKDDGDPRGQGRGLFAAFRAGAGPQHLPGSAGGALRPARRRPHGAADAQEKKPFERNCPGFLGFCAGSL